MKLSLGFLGIAASIAYVQAAPASHSGLAAAPIAVPKTQSFPVQINPNFSRSAKASVFKTVNKYKKFVKADGHKATVLASTGSVNMTDVQNDVEVNYLVLYVFDIFAF